jgi:hypothetical protein
MTLCLGAAASWSSAATVIWTGPSAGGSYNTPTNWHTGGVPGPADLSIFNSGTNVDGTITFDADTANYRTFVQNTAGVIEFDTGDYTWELSGFMLVGGTVENSPTIKHSNGKINFNRILLGSAGVGPSVEVTGANTHFHTRRGSGGYSIGVPADRASMLVHNGARMSGDGQAIIGLSGSSNSSLTIDGAGSTMELGNYLGVGHSGKTGNKASIINGATGAASHVLMAITAGSTDNTLTVSGAGSKLTLERGRESNVGMAGINNLLQITDGATVDGGGYFIIGKADTSNSGNQLVVNNSTLEATGIEALRGSVAVTNGNVSVSQWLNADEEWEGGNITVGDDAAALFTFNSGSIDSVSADVNNGVAFTVGDGGGSDAFYSMKKDTTGANGTHAFTGGLSLGSNGALLGNGNIAGDVSGSDGATVDVGTFEPGEINVAGAWDNRDISIEVDLYDLLDITGTFTHGGRIAVDVSGATVSGDLKLIGWGGQAGDSSDTSVSFVGDAMPYEFRSDGFYVVPEPGTLALLVLGLTIAVTAHGRQSNAKRST